MLEGDRRVKSFSLLAEMDMRPDLRHMEQLHLEALRLESEVGRRTENRMSVQWQEKV